MPQFEKILYNYHVKMQQLFFRHKIAPNEINLIVYQIFMMIASLQELQLISGSNSSGISKNQNFPQLLQKYSLNFMNSDKSPIILILLFVVQIWSLILNGIALSYRKVDFLSRLFQYFQLIHHFILKLPIMKTTFDFILQNQYMPFALITLILSILQELQFCIFNTQNKLIEIQGCFSKRFYNLIYYLTLLVITYFQSGSNTQVSHIIFLIMKLFQLFCNIHNYHYNSDFFLKINTFILSYSISLLADQIDMCTILIFIALVHLRTQFRQKQLQEEIIDKKRVVNIFKYSLQDNREFSRNFRQLSQYFQICYKNQLKQYEQFTIKNGLLDQKILILVHLYNDQKIQLYLNLININKTNISYSQRARLEANLSNALENCQQLITSSLNVRLFIKSLENEQLNIGALIELIDKKVMFYKFLIKDIPQKQYFDMFRKEKNQMQQFLHKFQNNFSQQFNIIKTKLKGFHHSDQVTINIIQAFYQIFYNNHFKVLELEKKRNELVAYDKIMNYKIKKNQAMLISVSHIQNPNTILNKTNKRIQQSFQNNQIPKQFIDLLPQFQRQFYQRLLNQYISSGFEIEQPIKLYFEINQFLIEYDLYLYSTISCDDIIIHHFLIQRNQPNHFLLFNTNGKILGISKDIFQYLTQIIEQIQIQDFIQQGMIQYYIPDIVNHVSEFCKIQQQPNTQNYMKIISKWQFPQNHEYCQQSTPLIVTELTKPQTAQSKKKKITMLKDEAVEYLKQIIVHEVGGQDQIEFFGQLEFQSLNQDIEILQLKFNEINNNNNMEKTTFIQKNGLDKILLEEESVDNQIKSFQIITDDIHCAGLEQDFEFLEHILNQNSLYSPFKYNIVITVLMIIISIVALIVCYNSNFQSTLYYQDQVIFLQTPQSMTFCYAEPYLLNWNKMNAEIGQYKISPFIEDQSLGMLAYVFFYCNSVRQVYTLNLSERSSALGHPSVFLVSYTQNGTRQSTEMDFFQFYTITQEELIRQYYNSVNSSEIDYSIFMADSIQRQNILTVLNYHAQVLDDIISKTETSFSELSKNNFMILFYLTLIIILLLSVLVQINLKLIRFQENIAKLFRFLNKEIIQHYIKDCEWQKGILSNLFLHHVEKSKTMQTEKSIQVNQKANTLLKLDQYRESYSIVFLMSFVVGIELIVFIFGSQLVALLYNSPYQSSLLLTMQYSKLKNRLDSAILIGELIKTEQYIPNNNMSLINQSESIQYFLDSVDVVVNLSNKMNEELAQTVSYNSTFKKRLVDIFDYDLCKTYAHLLPFCNVQDITLPYYKNDDYKELVSNGIYGLIQALSKLRKQEYNQEATTKTYQYDELSSKAFLNSQIHQNLFVSYYMDIQKCFYYCFVDIFTETQNLSNGLLHQIYIYLIVSSTVQILFIKISFFFVTTTISFFWIKTQQNKLNQVKLLATLFPPFLLQQKGFNKLLYSQLLQIN